MKYTVNDIYEGFEFADATGAPYVIRNINRGRDICSCIKKNGILENPKFPLSQFVSSLNEGKRKDLNQLNYEIY